MEHEPPMRTNGASRIEEHALLGELQAAPREAFTFDGRVVRGRRGEPLAAALLAAGIRVFRTMPRYGDPRGGYCLVGRCTDCQVIVDGVPGVRACVRPVADGLVVQTQHGLGDLSTSGNMPEQAS